MDNCFNYGHGDWMQVKINVVSSSISSVIIVF